MGTTLYAEGVQPGEVTVNLEGKIDNDDSRRRIDRIRLIAVKIDVDVDSDNTNTTSPYGPDAPAATPPAANAEDRIEEKAGEPGRLVLVNDDDDDQDGILDYDDGYNKDGVGGNADDRTFVQGQNGAPDKKEDDFVMLKVKIEPSSINLDPDKAWVRVTYLDASPDPTVASTPTPSPPPPNQPWPPGRIRIWKRPGDVPRDKRSALSTGQGDWIAPGEYRDLKRLMPWNASAQPPANPPATHEMTLYIEGVAPSQALGDAKITFSIDPDGQGPAGYVHMDIVQVTVVKVDLDADADRNGLVEDSATDEAWETVATIQRGAILLVNCDDDDKSSYPGPDANIPYTTWSNVNVSFPFEDKRINGPADVNDLAPLVIRQSPIPPGWGMRLEITRGAQHCHVFRQRMYDTSMPANNVAVLGPTSGSGTGTKYWVLDSALLDQIRAAEATLGVEAAHFAGQDGFDGIVELRLVLDRDTDPTNGNDVPNSVDVVQFRAAPFLLLSNVDPPLQFYVKNEPGDGTAGAPSNQPFITDLTTHAGVPVAILQGPSAYAEKWLQDEVEIGYQQAPYSQMHVVLDLYYSRGATSWPPKRSSWPRDGSNRCRYSARGRPPRVQFRRQY